MAVNKDLRLSIRTTEYEKNRLIQAANAKGIPVSQFVIQSSLEAASEVLAEENQINLSPQEFDWLLSLTEKSSDVSALKNLVKQPTPWTK